MNLNWWQDVEEELEEMVHDTEDADLAKEERKIIGKLYSVYEEVSKMTSRQAQAEHIAKQINSLDSWNDDLNRKLCELAGIGSEYKAADGDSFEAVVFKAADILNVSI